MKLRWEVDQENLRIIEYKPIGICETNWSKIDKFNSGPVLMTSVAEYIYFDAHRIILSFVSFACLVVAEFASVACCFAIAMN